MVLIADIGNSSITVGLFRTDAERSYEELICKSKYSTDTRKSADEYAALIYNALTINSVKAEDIEGVMISSVVPQLTYVIKEAISKLVKVRIYVLGPGLKTGINIRTDSPSELGSDIVANAVGALDLVKPPLVVIDVGTATSVFAVNKDRAIIGGAIAPGMRVSLDSLKNATSQLPFVSLDAPKRVIGKNTDDSMRAGLIFGHALMIDGMIDAFSSEMGEDALTAVVTGGLSSLVTPLLKHDIVYFEDLTLQGLLRIYKNNTKQSV